MPGLFSFWIPASFRRPLLTGFRGSAVPWSDQSVRIARSRRRRRSRSATASDLNDLSVCDGEANNHEEASAWGYDSSDFAVDEEPVGLRVHRLWPHGLL